jgi:hypothetical protein
MTKVRRGNDWVEVSVEEPKPVKTKSKKVSKSGEVKESETDSTTE